MKHNMIFKRRIVTLSRLLHMYMSYDARTTRERTTNEQRNDVNNMNKIEIIIERIERNMYDNDVNHVKLIRDIMFTCDVTSHTRAQQIARDAMKRARVRATYVR